jgi:ABC-type multidrug transport system ATPase subunit
VRPGATARTFSRGMQQRLALARALLTEPDLLLFDEPGSALDPAGAAWLSTVVAAERTAGRIVILVTHDLDAAATVAEHVVVLRRGRVAFDQTRPRFAAPEVRALYEEHTRD